MRTTWLLAGLTVTLAGCAEATARRDILRANDSLYHAIAARDLTTLARVTAPDFHFAAQGHTGDRAAFFAGVAAQPMRVEWITNDELRLDVAGARAELCGRQRAIVIVAGQRVQDSSRFCDRWQRRDGRWVVTDAGEPPARGLRQGVAPVASGSTTRSRRP